MFKLFVLAIFLITPSTFGLLHGLYQIENSCYSGCQSNYADNLSNLDACKKGCDLKLHKENCADQCKLFSTHEQLQASCVVGCSMIHTDIKQTIILVRKRPLFRLPFSNSDPIKIMNDALKEFKENSKSIEKSNELKQLLDSVKTIPLVQSSDTNPSSKVKHIMMNQEDTIDHLGQFIKNIPSKSTPFIYNRTKLSIWILLSIIMLTSAILLHKIIFLCCKTPKHHNLSVHAEELIFEKNVLRPDSQIKLKIEDI